MSDDSQDARRRGEYVHSENSKCVLESEGSFEERRSRLDNSLQQSMKVTKSDLMQRNIVQGVNVVRRGSRAVEGLLAERPSLDELVAKNRLPSDYIDKAFPSKVEDSVAPKAERIERVSLQRLLPASGSAPPPGAPLDPATLAAMVVQACRMPGQGFAGQVPAQMQPPGWPAQPLSPQMQSGPWPAPLQNPQLDVMRQAMAASMQSAQQPPQLQSPPRQLPQQQGIPAPAAVAAGTIGYSSGAGVTSPLSSMQPLQVNASVGPASVPMSSQPRPEMPVTVPLPVEPPRAHKPEFVRLLDEFCEKAMAKEAVRATPTK